MTNFLDLSELQSQEVGKLLTLAKELQLGKHSDLLAGKVLGLIFMEPSVRTLASFQTAMAKLGGTSFVISPGRGSWGFEWQEGVTMDQDAAEHLREAIPVLSQYADALGLRCFGQGQSLLDDLAEPILRTAVEFSSKPMINLESATAHPCQALADWKTLDDKRVPQQGGRFVLSWANHPKALPYAVPRSTLLMAAQRGMDVTVLAPRGFELPTGMIEEAQHLAKSAGGRVSETSDKDAALVGAHVIYAKSWRSQVAYHSLEDEQALRRQLDDWCVDDSWFNESDPEACFMHCLPVRRNVVVSDSVLDGPRSSVIEQAGNRLYVQMAVLANILATERIEGASK